MKKHYPRVGILTFVTLFSLLSWVLQGGNLPNGFTELRLAEGMDGTTVHYAPDGRLFVTQKKGLISIIKNGALLTPFLSIESAVDNRNERGLQNLVFDPNFSTNGYIYIYYCALGQNRNRVSRFTANGDVVTAGSELILLNLDALPADIHNGGALFFKDSKLFVTTGEGGNGSLAQSFSSLLGKVLRINPDGSIPADNPFYSTLTGNYRMIYALGLRNPYRADIQPGTGRVFINDVGGSNFEEINELFPGKNYGWPTVEGKRTTQTPPLNYQDPIYAYSHSMGCSIGGGKFYNPVSVVFPSKYAGKYFFGDYCGNYIKVLDPNTGLVTETFATNINRPISFTIGDDGSFYYLARGGLGGGSKNANTQSCCSEVWRIQFTNSGVPSISAQPSNLTVPVGGEATFVVGASGNAPLNIQWQRNGVNILGATSYIYEIAAVTLADNNAQFRAVVSNSLGTATSATVVLTVVNNMAPVPTIITPGNESTFIAGAALNFSGSATDAEDGVLPPSALTWSTIFHHDTHTHPGMDPTSGISGGSYVTGNREPAPNIWYRVYLTATDSHGEQTTIFQDVYPILSTVTLSTNTPGLKLGLDGVEGTSPLSFTSAAGAIRNISAPAQQIINGITYQFAGWSDGGSADHDILTPTANQTITATYTSSVSNVVFPPVFTPPPGTYTSAQSVSITSDTPGATIYFTTDGSTPTTTSWRYGSPITMGVTRTLKAIAVKTGMTNSSVTTAPYIINPTQNPGFTALLEGENAVLSGVDVKSSQPGFTGTGFAHYIYNLDAYIEWSVNVPAAGPYNLTFRYANGTSLDRPLQMSINGIIAEARKSFPPTGLWTTWVQVNSTVNLAAGLNIIRATTVGSIGPNMDHLVIASDGVSTPTAIAPTFTPLAGNYTAPVNVAMSTSTAGSVIHYTLDGTTPTTSSSVYSAPVTISATTTVKAFAKAAGFNNSTISTAAYIISAPPLAATPTFTPAAGNYTAPVNVALSSSTAGSVIYYTLDGSVPTTASLVYTSPINISVSTTVKALAKAVGFSNSAIASAAYVINIPVPMAVSPTFTPAAGTYSSAVTVGLSTTTAGATIYYTLNGTTPTTASSMYASPLTISQTTTVKAFATAAGFGNSAISSSAYVINTDTNPPFSSILEAENANLIDGVLVKSKYAGFTGTGYVTYTLTRGQSIEWTVNVPAAGQYVLDFRYANGATKDRPLDIVVNGTVAEAKKPFPYTGSWSTWGIVSKTVTLAAGNNTVRANSIGSTGGNMDHLKISNAAPGARTSLVADNELGFAPEDNLSIIDIYPLPAREVLTVKSKFNIEVVAIESLEGSLLHAAGVAKDDQEWEIDLSGLSSGLYILNVRGDGRVVRRKFVVEH